VSFVSFNEKEDSAECDIESLCNQRELCYADAWNLVPLDAGKVASEISDVRSSGGRRRRRKRPFRDLDIATVALNLSEHLT